MHRPVFIALLLIPRLPLAAPATGQWETGLSAVYSYLVVNTRPQPAGGGVGIQCAYGLSDAFDARISGVWTAQSVEASGDTPEGLFHVITADVGLGYALDAIPLAPRLEAAVGLLHRRFGATAATDLGVKLGLNLGTSLGKNLWVGFVVYYHGFLTDLGNVPVYVELGPQIAWRWGEGRSTP